MRLPRWIAVLALTLAYPGLSLAVPNAGASAQEMQTPPTSAAGAPLLMNVDEVVFTFHATDARGATVKGLTAGDIRIRDNGVPPRRIVAFDEVQNRAIRVGILLDAKRVDAADDGGQ